MRLALNRLAVAITAMVALAFLVPLAGVTRQLAHDRALGDARQQAAAIVTALAVDSSPALLARAVASTAAGGAGRLAVHLPPVASPGDRSAASPGDKSAASAVAPIGVSRAAAADVTAARGGRSITRTDGEGLLYLQPSVLNGSQVAVIEVFVPRDELYRGVWPAWLALAGLAVVLVAGSTLFADRLGSRTVRATRDLAEVTRRFGAGDLTVRAEPSGPPELKDAARNFNAMADNLRERIDAERELAADLSHRLRTPLTALRLDADAVPPGPVADRLRQAFDVLDAELEAIITGARLSASKRTAQSTDLVEALADRLAFWSVLAEDQGRHTRIVGGEQPVPVPVPRGELILAIDALLGNVFAHTPEGTPLQVTVSEHGMIVDDAGPGIRDPEAAVRRGASGAGSTGLGLDIAQRVARAAGGRLEIAYGPLGGARVAIFLTPTPGSLRSL